MISASEAYWFVDLHEVKIDTSRGLVEITAESTNGTPIMGRGLTLRLAVEAVGRTAKERGLQLKRRPIVVDEEDPTQVRTLIFDAQSALTLAGKKIHEVGDADVASIIEEATVTARDVYLALGGQ